MVDNARLPIEVEAGARGGPGFKTTIFAADSGHERRNVDWERSRGRWDISYGITDKTTLDVVRDFFMAQRGRAYGFRFRDWNDYTFDQVIGTGDGTETAFQVFKRYGSGARNFDRVLTTLVAGTLTVHLDDVAQESGVTVDVATAIVTFDAAPAEDAEIHFAGQFDVPARFDVDRLKIETIMADDDGNGIVGIPAIPIVELRQGS